MKDITFFNAFTLPYVVIFHIMMFFVMNEYRYPRKKAAYLTMITHIPVLVLTGFIYFFFGSEKGGQWAVLFYIIPQIIISLLLSKYRDGRTLSTYFLVSGINIFIIQVSNLIDYFVPYSGHRTMFLIRLISYPVAFFLLKRFGITYRKVMNIVNTGWNLFAYISGLHVVILMFIFNFPTTLTKRPYDIPILILIFGAMLFVNLFFVDTILRQRDFFLAEETTRILKLQMDMMNEKVKKSEEISETTSIMRHDLRHILTTLSEMLSEEDTEAKAYIDENVEVLKVTKEQRWCLHPALNAMFTAYFSEAENKGIKVDAKIDIEDIKEDNPTALSLAFANAIENAIHAVEGLDEEKRIIRVRAVTYPQLMFQVSNPYEGEIIFDENGIPISKETGHGLGIRSILAYCERQHAVCNFKAEDGWFKLWLVKPS